MWTRRVCHKTVSAQSLGGEVRGETCLDAWLWHSGVGSAQGWGGHGVETSARRAAAQGATVPFGCGFGVHTSQATCLCRFVGRVATGGSAMDPVPAQNTTAPNKRPTDACTSTSNELGVDGDGSLDSVGICLIVPVRRRAGLVIASKHNHKDGRAPNLLR